MSEDDNIGLILAKVGGLVERRFGGDYRAAFGHYDGNGDGAISNEEMTALLSDAGVGNWFTRWTWVNGVMSRVDANKDGHISWAEFRAQFRLA
jgi:Ca2+-binding EF-hand superfamily protein